MEMYLFNQTVLDKVFSLVVGRQPKSIPEIQNELARVLQEVFLIRAANERLSLNASMLDIRKCCSIQGDVISFDGPEYVRRFLKHGSIYPIEKLSDEIDRLRSRLQADPRNGINGHDFVALLRWYLASHCGHSDSRAMSFWVEAY
jgi:hypothetical protein